MNDIQRLRAFAQSTIDAAMGLPHLCSTDVLEDAKRLGLLAPNIVDRPCRRDCPCASRWRSGWRATGRRDC